MSFKNERIASNIQRHISHIIQYDLNDSDVGHVTVTDVEVTNDLSYATIYVTFFDDRGVPTERIAALNKAKGFIRTGLAQKLTTYKTPELIFKYDESLNAGAKIDDLLKKVK